jgi:hypothetical protein
MKTEFSDMIMRPAPVWKTSEHGEPLEEENV